MRMGDCGVQDLLSCWAGCSLHGLEERRISKTEQQQGTIYVKTQQGPRQQWGTDVEQLHTIWEK